MPNLNLTSIEVKRQSQSEIHWAHSSKDVGFLCQCSLSQLEFLNYFYILAILIYDISNKILKLTLFDHIYFWPLLASFRGCWKTFFLRLMQQWLVGRFDSYIECCKPVQNEFWMPSSLQKCTIFQPANLKNINWNIHAINSYKKRFYKKH